MPRALCLQWLYIRLHLSLVRPCAPPCESSSRRLSRIWQKKKKECCEETRLRNFNSFRSRSDVTTGCPAGCSSAGLHLKKKEKKSPSSPGGSYRIICSSTGFSCLQPPCLILFLLLRCTLLYFIPFFAFAINFLFEISLYIIKLSYYRARIHFSLKSSIHLFICLTSFSIAFYLFTILSFFFSLFLLLCSSQCFASFSHTLFLPASFLVFFFTLFKRECPYLRRHFAYLKATKARTRDYKTVHPIVSPRTRSCFARIARRDARESAEPAF